MPASPSKADIPAPPGDGSPRRWNTIGLVVLGILGVTALGVCGACGAGLYTMKPSFNEDPQAAAALQQEILPFTPPQGFTPQGTIIWKVPFVMTMSGVYLETADEGGLLSLTQLSSRFLNDADIRQHIVDTMRSRGAGTGSMQIEASDDRLLIVRGDEVPFRFETAYDPLTRERYRLMEGVVTGREGPVLITLRANLMGDWNDQTIIESLQSIE